jgi:hypothetical protein
MPVSMSGDQAKLVMGSLKSLTFPGWAGIAPQAKTAIRALYRAMPGPLGEDVPSTLAALATAETARRSASQGHPAGYPAGNFGNAMTDLATLLKAEVGLQGATGDVVGWNTHTDEANGLDRLSTAVAVSEGQSHVA